MGQWWVEGYLSAGRGVFLVAHIFWVIASITLHELAHGWAAIWQGDRTPIIRGHMTASPLVHMGGMSLIIFALCGIAWGAMPVNPHNFRDKHGDLYVSAAGPAMNLALALLCVIAAPLWIAATGAGTDLQRHGVTFFFAGCVLNLVLAALNLLPVPPLDGSRILASLSRRAREWFRHPNAQLFGLFFFIAVFFMSPIGTLIWRYAFGAAFFVIDLFGGPLGNPPFTRLP